MQALLPTPSTLTTLTLPCHHPSALLLQSYLYVPDCTGCLGDNKASLRRSTPLFYVGCSLQLAGSQKQRTCLPISRGQSGPPTLATRWKERTSPEDLSLWSRSSKVQAVTTAISLSSQYLSAKGVIWSKYLNLPEPDFLQTTTGDHPRPAVLMN